MKLQLKKVKIYDELSEETICFTAELYADGKKVATVKNDGRGGKYGRVLYGRLEK